MARLKTVHTPEPAETQTRVTFSISNVKLAEFGRTDPADGWIKFHAALGKGFESLFEMMKWQVPGPHTALQRLDGKIPEGTLLLKSTEDKLKAESPDGTVKSDAEVNIEFDSINGFECHRLELEGRKKKGYRRELRFTIKYHCRDGAANLEAYMMATDNARGSLRIAYTREPEQQELDGVQATEEQRQAVMDLEAEK